jgi:hypothetical protein
MVMCNNNRRRIAAHRLFEDLAHPDHGGIDRAAIDLGDSDEPIFVG